MINGQRSDTINKLPPVTGLKSARAGVVIEETNREDTPGSTLKAQLEELLNPKAPEMDPKAVTKQMLLTCKVLRRRNTNVTPLEKKNVYDRYNRGGTAN